MIVNQQNERKLFSRSLRLTAALATPYGMPNNTNKAILMHKLAEKWALQTTAQEKEHIHLIDGSTFYQALLGLPETLGELAHKICCALPKVSKIHVLAHNYKDDYQILWVWTH